MIKEKTIIILFLIFTILPALTSFAETGEDLLTKGIESYNSGDYSNTQKLLTRAIPLIKEKSKAVEAHKYLAFVHIAYGENQKAHNEFIEALKIDNTFRLDPKMTSPKIMEVFRKAKAEIVSEGAISIITKPEGAKVYLNGNLIGETPLRQNEIVAGEHKIIIKKRGYEPIEAGITVKDKILTNIEHTLTEATGILNINTAPGNATVIFDNESIGNAPLKIKNVSSGAHTLKISKKGYDDLVKELAFNKGEEKALTTALKKRVVLLGPLTEKDQQAGAATAKNLIIETLRDLPFHQLITVPEEKEAELLGQYSITLAALTDHLHPLPKIGNQRLREASERLNSELFIITGIIKDKTGPKLLFGLFHSEMERPDMIIIDILQEDVKRPLIKIKKTFELSPDIFFNKSLPIEIRTPFNPPLIRGDAGGVDLLFNLFVDRINEMARDKETAGYGYLNLGSYHLHLKNWKEAIAAYNQVALSNKEGLGKGTAIFRIGEVYENLGYWSEAAEYYYRAMAQFPQNTLISNQGEAVSSAAQKRLKRLRSLGLIREKY